MIDNLPRPDFPSLCSLLSDNEVAYLVIGGWAAIAHGIPRSTLDVGLFIRPDKGNSGRLIATLSRVGFGISRELSPEEILSKKVFLFSDQIRIDVFAEPWGLDGFESCWSRRLETTFESVTIPFLGLEDLLKSKNTDRDQDQADAEALKRIVEKRKRD